MHLLLGLSLFFSPPPPFVSVEEGARLLAEHATVVDTREAAEFAAGHLPGAVRIDWTDYRDGTGQTGRLDDDMARLAHRLAEKGIDEKRPILVYGAVAHGWGEEGRIAWTLDYLGHSKVSILDGGFAAWSAAARPIERGAGTPPSVGKLSAHPRAELRADRDAVMRARSDGKTVILDVRTQKEWDGAVLYHEPRGGHIPGARHLEWSTLVDKDGRLPAPEVLRGRLATVGIGPKSHVITYCTGGVRAAFVAELLRGLAIDAKNYDGSFFDWAAHTELPVTVGGAP